jgi:HSP20 family protein
MAMTPWEPIDEAMDDAFGGFMPLRRAMNRLFEESLLRPSAIEPFRQLFPLNLQETGSDYVIDASLPGVKPQEIKVTAAENTLTIQATRKTEEKKEQGGKYVRRELYEGEVGRTIRLPGPVNADKITATYEHGVLRLQVPKAEAAKYKQITVQVKDTSKTS